ncbi:rhamnogalacturonan acetylesterase [Enterococcus gallinarum]|uniref:rhamnogalacturonan acetylesterase n=1 Tax=Enterococcus gallinarum TaxID=1353 RepID=UPI001D171B40|nr:rhamnogalacturonan acetylesterase [Enterococcus gallinarum]MCC4046139.1 rhamnogalacturonan acetylesterase [Enterococcus gallinarum]
MVKLIIVGDSTAATKMTDKRPETGWGEKIPTFLSPEVTVIHLAMNGRSTKSVIQEKRLLHAEQLLASGDYFLIQFGHNDQKTDPERGTTPKEYQENLAQFVAVAQKKQANPVLLTSITRLKFHQNNDLDPLAMGPYSEAMREFAAAFEIPCLDIFKMTQNYFSTFASGEARQYFLHLSKNEHPNYPEGISDNTHLNDQGALIVARLICQAIKESNLALSSEILL